MILVVFTFCICVLENQRDKLISRMEEYSDSEDEDDDHRDEKSHRENKRPRLMDDKSGVSRSSARSQLLSSPLPPEPSPLTPVLLDDSSTTEQRGMYHIVYVYLLFTPILII